MKERKKQNQEKSAQVQKVCIADADTCTWAGFGLLDLLLSQAGSNANTMPNIFEYERHKSQEQEYCTT